MKQVSAREQKKISVRQSKQEVAPELFVKLIEQSILVLR